MELLAVTQQGFDVRFGPARQTFEAVAAFENRYQAVPAMARGGIGHQFCQLPKIFVHQQKASERIAGAGIKPGRDQEEVGPEGINGRKENFLECSYNFTAS